VVDDHDRAWEVIHRQECWGGKSSGTCRITTDHAGRTLHGIAERYHPHLWADGREPTADQARDVFVSHYWQASGCHRLPWPISLAMADYAYNSGSGRAVRELQDLIGADADGRVGPMTVFKVQEWANREVARALMDRRREAVKGFAHYDKYGNGWEARLDRLSALIG
jgi:lysozyme family protein